MTIGEKIALRRRTAGLSQEALAARLGVSRQAVSRWETGESLPDAEKIVQLCQILGVSADELLMKNAQPTLRGSQFSALRTAMGQPGRGASALLRRVIHPCLPSGTFLPCMGLLLYHSRHRMELVYYGKLPLLLLARPSSDGGDWNDS